MSYLNLDKLVNHEIEFEGQKYCLKQFKLTEILEFVNKTKDLDLAKEEDNKRYSDILFETVYQAFEKQGYNSTITLEKLKECMYFNQAWCLYMTLSDRGNLLTEDGKLKEDLIKNLIEALKKK